MLRTVFLFLIFTSGMRVPIVSSAGIALDYKVFVNPGSEDCYYQYVEPEATLSIGYQVIRGGDGKVGFRVRHPNGTELLPYAWQDRSEYERTFHDGGYFEFCFDNTRSRLQHRLLALYIVVFRYEEWAKYAKEIEELHVSVVNFTTVIQGVDNRTQQMLHYLHDSRTEESRDYALIEDNLSAVTWWSVFQCIIIILTAILQIVFVRRIFDAVHK